MKQNVLTKEQQNITFTAVLPHAQINLRNVTTAAVTMGKLCHPEDVLLDACDVISIVTQHPCKRGLLQLGQLGRSEYARIFIPESEKDRTSKRTDVLIMRTQ